MSRKWRIQREKQIRREQLERKRTFHSIMNRKRKQHAFNFLSKANDMRINDRLCDYTIIVGDEEIRVHKIIMVACSEYFETLFNSDMREAHEDRLHLDVLVLDPDGLRGAVDYAYTGRLDMTEENIYSIVQAAAYLRMPKLLKQCNNYFHHHIDVNNCLNFIRCADLYSQDQDDMMYSTCVFFIRDNILKLSKLKLLNSLSAKQLCDVLHSQCLSVKSELSVIRIVQNWMRANKGIELNEAVDVGDVTEEPWTSFINLVYTIRWPLISANDLRVYVNSDITNVMSQIPQCKELLDKAEYYHSHIHEQPLLQMESEQTWNRHHGLSMLTSDADAFTVFSMHDPVSGAIRQIEGAADTMRVYKHSVVMVNNFMFVCGGMLAPSWDLRRRVLPEGMTVTARCQRYDPRFNSWLELSPMSVIRQSFALVTDGTHLFAMGGVGYGATLQSTERYDIKTDTWTSSTDMPASLMNHAGCVVNDTVYISGGKIIDEAGQVIVSSVYKHNMTTEEWQQCAEMHYARDCHAMGNHGASIYVVGGNRSDEDTKIDPVTRIERYSLDTNQWSWCRYTAGYTTKDVPLYAIGAGCCVGDFDDIYILGGVGGGRNYNRLVINPQCADDLNGDESQSPLFVEDRAYGMLHMPNSLSDLTTQPIKLQPFSSALVRHNVDSPFNW